MATLEEKRITESAVNGLFSVLFSRGLNKNQTD